MVSCRMNHNTNCSCAAPVTSSSLPACSNIYGTIHMCSSLLVIFAISCFGDVLVQNFLYFFFFCINFTFFIQSDTISPFFTWKSIVFVFFPAISPYLHQNISKGVCMIQNLDAHLNKLQAQCDYLRHKLVKSFFVCKFTFSLLGYCILCGVLAELCKDAALFFIVFCHIE